MAIPTIAWAGYAMSGTSNATQLKRHFLPHPSWPLVCSSTTHAGSIITYWVGLQHLGLTVLLFVTCSMMLAPSTYRRTSTFRLVSEPSPRRHACGLPWVGIPNGPIMVSRSHGTATDVLLVFLAATRAPNVGRGRDSGPGIACWTPWSWFWMIFGVVECLQCGRCRVCDGHNLRIAAVSHLPSPWKCSKYHLWNPRRWRIEC